MNQITFQHFDSVKQAIGFGVFDARPEFTTAEGRDVLGDLPDGSLVYARYWHDEDNDVVWCVADL